MINSYKELAIAAFSALLAVSIVNDYGILGVISILALIPYHYMNEIANEMYRLWIQKRARKILIGR